MSLTFPIISSIVRPIVSSIVASANNAITRYFIDLDPVLNSYYSLSTPKVFAGDFEIEADIYNDGAGVIFQGIFGGSDVGSTTRAYSLILKNDGQLLFNFGDGTTFKSMSSLVGAYTVNKLSTVKVSRVANLFTIFLDGVSLTSATLTGSPTTDIDRVGSYANANLFNGILANVKLTDLATPSNSESYTLGEATANIEYPAENVFGEIWNDVPTSIGTGWADNLDGSYTCTSLGNIISDNDNVISDGEVVTVTYTVDAGMTGTVRALIYGVTQVGVGTTRSSAGTYTETITINSATGSGEATGRVGMQSLSSFVGTIRDISVLQPTNALTYNNIPTSIREEFTLVDGDWLGGELLPTPLQFDSLWSLSGSIINVTNNSFTPVGTGGQGVAYNYNTTGLIRVAYDISSGDANWQIKDSPSLQGSAPDMVVPATANESGVVDYNSVNAGIYIRRFTSDGVTLTANNLSVKRLIETP